MTTKERLARVTLSKLTEPGDPGIARLVNELGAETVVASLRHPSLATENMAIRLERIDPQAELDSAERMGIRFVIPGDDEWPGRLGDLDGHVRSERGDVPVGLWVKGDRNLREVTEDTSVAVIGSRTSTTYGTSMATEIGDGLALAGQTVISGGAFGIDQAAHRGALARRGLTVAVLATGVDRAYPEAHRALFDRIADTGLLVSETPPSSAPTRLRFLARNRIIAALSQGTVVVEGAVRSGALAAANWAATLDRPVMGVPGPVTSAQSVGVHQLLRHGATLVTGPDDVLETLGVRTEVRA